MKTNSDEPIRGAVRARYAGIAQGAADDCGCSPGSCCSPDAEISLNPSVRLGYSEAELLTVPEGANLGLGCGNPQAIANLRPGEVVLDLGSGAGFDCFLAARQVGAEGRVIGVDMTPEMIAKARGNAAPAAYGNARVPPGGGRAGWGWRFAWLRRSCPPISGRIWCCIPLAPAGRPRLESSSGCLGMR